MFAGPKAMLQLVGKGEWEPPEREVGLAIAYVGRHHCFKQNADAGFVAVSCRRWYDCCTCRYGQTSEVLRGVALLLCF